jgi:L-amino acid N-acyltransferase YncA
MIRDAREADLPTIAAVYEREAHGGWATFDTEGRTPAAWRDQLGGGPGHHLLVAAEDDVVLGYAASTRFRPKPGYDLTRETTIYLAAEGQGRGVGRALYDELLDRLSADGMHLALAAVALPNDASVALHRACSYTEVGVMREVGRKLGRWIDVQWWQRRLR